MHPRGCNLVAIWCRMIGSKWLHTTCNFQIKREHHDLRRLPRLHRRPHLQRIRP
nr:MAG TPA: hypothetical protein [Bacteriophage sp.]